MPAVPSGIIVMYAGAHADSHSGWSRKTELDGQHIQINNTPGAGGAANHTHTENAHTHPVVGAATGGGDPSLGVSLRYAVAPDRHTHGESTSSSATATLQTANNNPLSYTVIFKVSDGSADIFTNALCFWNPDGTPLPPGWSAPAGPQGYFPKGAAPGADGGATSGVASHTHIEDTHSHAAAPSAACGSGPYLGTGTKFASGAHTHNVTLAVNGTLGKPVTTISDSYDVPAYEKLLIIQNDSAGLAYGVICLIMAESTIPDGWEQFSLTSGCDFVKGAVSVSDSGTGGTRQHNHTALTSHGHAASGATISTSVGNSGELDLYAVLAHTHKWTATDVPITVNNCAERAAYPPFTNVILVKYIAVKHALAALGAGA